MRRRESDDNNHDALMQTFDGLQVASHQALTAANDFVDYDSSGDDDDVGDEDDGFDDISELKPTTAVSQSLSKSPLEPVNVRVLQVALGDAHMLLFLPVHALALCVVHYHTRRAEGIHQTVALICRRAYLPRSFTVPPHRERNWRRLSLSLRATHILGDAESGQVRQGIVCRSV